MTDYSKKNGASATLFKQPLWEVLSCMQRVAVAENTELDKDNGVFEHGAE